MKRIILLAVALALTACDEPSPPAPAIQLSADARAVQALRDQLNKIESPYDDASKILVGLMNDVDAGKVAPADRDDWNAKFKTAMEIRKSVIAQSAGVAVPEIADPAALGYVQQTIAAHKAWALASQSRDAAFFAASPDLLKQVENFKNAADAASAKEAANLILAYRQVGLPVTN